MDKQWHGIVSRGFTWYEWRMPFLRAGRWEARIPRDRMMRRFADAIRGKGV